MQEQINKLQLQLNNLEHRIAALENATPEKLPASSPVLKKLSIKELMLEKGPKNDIQKTLVIGYYLEHFEDVTPFNADDIEKGFRLAKEALPLNINDRVNSNINAGYIMEHSEKKNSRKAWLLTATGERFVEAGFKK